MKFSAVAVCSVLVCASGASAWSNPPSPQSRTNSRRQVLQQSFLGAASFLVATQPAFAGLLDEYGGTDSMKIEPVADKKSTQKNKAVVVSKAESNMEPNLRSNYYYPTNKKRYLPRIKKCNDAIPGAAEAIGTENWESAQEFVEKIADDTILPMRLCECSCYQYW